MKKYTIFIFSFILIFMIYSNMSPNILKITFCDVGQGDATIVSLGKVQVLIDTGRNSKVLTCLENHMPFFDKQIEYLVLTHMDSDHIGGVPEVFEYYDVNFVFMNPSNKKTSDFSLLEEVLSKESPSKTKVISTFFGQTLYVGNGLVFTVLSPNMNFTREGNEISSSTETTLLDVFKVDMQEKLKNKSENSLSIVLKVLFKDVEIILPGDLELNGELAVIDSGLLENVALLKAGHHGSKTSSNRSFIEVLRPEITIISSGINNAYNHPSPQVIDTFESFDVAIYQTKSSGEINFASDGTQIWEVR
jgi:competence protein ComEC